MSNAPTRSPKPHGEELGTVRVTRKRKGTERVTIQTVRKGMGRTQTEVADAMGTSQGEVSEIERRQYLRTLRRFAAALDMELDVALVMKDGRRFRIADPEE